MNNVTEDLINEVRLLYQSMVQVGERVHASRNITMGMRAVLEYLIRNGDATVPHIARERRVTRQRIQSLVNKLMDGKLVVAIPNPATQRSPLIQLTAIGAKTIVDMRRVEREEMQYPGNEKKLREATYTLRALRKSLEQQN